MEAESAINNSLPLSLTLHSFALGFPNYTSGRLVWQRSNFEKPKCSDLPFVYVLAGCVRALPIIETGGAVGYEKPRFTTPFSFRRSKRWCLEHCGSARELIALASPLCVYKSPHFPFSSSPQLLEFLYHSRSTASESSRFFRSPASHLCAATCAPSVQ